MERGGGATSNVWIDIKLYQWGCEQKSICKNIGCLSSKKKHPEIETKIE